jgi:hypothetical protein
MVLYGFLSSYLVLSLNLLQMRAGTQTLIQALQALPWTSNGSSDNEDDVGAGESGSEDDEQPQSMYMTFKPHPKKLTICSETSSFVYSHYSPTASAISPPSYTQCSQSEPSTTNGTRRFRGCFFLLRRA